MTNFSPGNMLSAIVKELRYFQDKNGLPCNFIIIHENDTQQLIDEMVAAKMRPVGTNTDKIIIQSAKIIRTKDIKQGFFAVVLN